MPVKRKRRHKDESDEKANMKYGIILKHIYRPNSSARLLAKHDTVFTFVMKE
jgi:hypothetical protein